MTQPLETNHRRLPDEDAQWESYGADLLDHGVPFTAISDIQVAYQFAQKAHTGQLRASGEPYITHPLAVSRILLQAGITDPDLHIVALLHDVPEDNPDLVSRTVGQFPDHHTDDDWKRLGPVLFDKRVTDMVEALTEPTIDKYYYEDGKRVRKEKLYYDQLVSALTTFPEVILVKMADRLHNLRTLGAMSIAKQKNKIKETRKYYALFQAAVRKFPNLGAYLFGAIERTIAEHEHQMYDIPTD